MKSGLRIVWISLLGVGLCAGQQRPRAPRASARAGPAYLQRLKSFDESQFVTRAVLRNGLTVIVNEFRSTPVVTVGTYVSSAAGSDPEASGLSTLAVNMLLRGTATRPPGQMAREVAALGGEVAVQSDGENSSFEIVTPSMQWKKSLELAADALLNPKLDPEEMKRAVEQIRLDAARRLDRPDELAYESLLRLSLGQSAGEPEMQSLSGITPESLAKYFKTAFALPRVLLVVAGDVNAPDVLTDVVRYYDRPAAAAARQEPAAREEAQAGFRYREMRGGGGQAQVLFGFNSPPSGSPDLPAAEVLRSLLGAGEASVLNLRIRDGKKLINDGEAALLPAGRNRLLALRMKLDPANVDKCELALLAEAEILKRDEPDEDDVLRAIAQSEREFWEEQETVSGRARMLARFELLGGWKKMDQYLAQLRQVKPADIRRVASKYLDSENFSLLEYMPDTAEARGLQAETVLKSFRQLLDATVQQEMDAREKETRPAIDAPRPSMFKFSEVRSGFQKASILRGPELFIREDHTLPLIQMGFFFAGGRLTEPADRSGITALMLHSMLGATGEKSARQVYRQLEIYGGRLRPVVTADGFGFLFSVFSQNIDPALELLGQVVTAPKFEDDYVALRKEQQLWRIRSERDCNRRRADDLVDEALFRGQPYALRPDGTEGVVKGLSADAVRQWHKSVVEHRKPVVVIMGDTQGTTLAGYFVRNFSGSRFQDTVLPSGYAKPPEKGMAAEEKSGKRLSVVKLAFAAPPEGDEDGPAMSALCGLLGGTGGWVREQLEQRQALAAGVSVEYRPAVRGGAVVATAFTAPENEDRVLQSMQEELRRVFASPILYKDYRSALSAAIGRLQIAQQSRYLRIAMIVRSVLAGKGLEGVQEYPARIQDVSQDDLPDLARRVFDFGRSVTVRIHGHSE